MADEILKTVLRASLAEHLCAMRRLSESTHTDRTTARKALREWIGTQEHTAFQNIDDIGIMCVLLEEFANFAIFCGEQIQKENIQNFVGKEGHA